jgi:hypothetical protein
MAARDCPGGLNGGDTGTHDNGHVDDSAKVADATVALDITRLAATTRTTRRRVVRVLELPIA